MTVTALLIIGTASWSLYKKTSQLLDANLRERLLSIVTTSVVTFDPHDVEKLRIEDDWKKPEWAKVVHKMEKIRKNNKDILFMYMFRKSEADPTKMEFVTDSHSIDPFAKIDINGDGVVDDGDQLQWPGQPYPTAPEEAFEAYNGPLTNRETYDDQWGPVLTGYAPLLDERGNVVAVLAVDIRASDFATITRQTLIPFLIFSTGLVVIVLFLAGAIIYMGRNKISLLVETDEAKNATINVVAHQMGAVSTRFRWYAEMLKDGDSSKEECADQIESGNAELRNIASLFLDAAHVYSKKFSVSPAPLDLNVFFKRLSDAASLGASQQKLHYSASIPAKLPTVLLDEKHTYFSIENLLSNAIKYTPEGGKVEFMVTHKDGVLHIAVKDTGMGIPKQDKDKMFKQMYRASNTRNIDGNGLGLYIAKEAIELQGGKIWYESEGVPGKGTAFYVTLPLKTAPDEKVEKKK